MQTLFLGRQSPSRTVNDFSTSSRVMDNQKERVGRELLAHFFPMYCRWTRRSVHHCALVLRCTFSIWVLTLTVMPRAKDMMDSPPGSFPCFKGALKWGVCLGPEAPCQMRSHQMDHPQLLIRVGGPGRVAAQGKCQKLESREHICVAGIHLWHEEYKSSSKLRHVNRGWGRQRENRTADTNRR